MKQTIYFVKGEGFADYNQAANYCRQMGENENEITPSQDYIWLNGEFIQMD